ncbi:hypothetical protein IAD21_02799 [Abditibacteriota bacterium]|nr:hypothetical protein IAD21_02799 [Abditibacteriota bacterium]
MNDNLSVAKEYLEAIENGATGEALAQFYAPEAIQEELPNRLMPQGARRDLAAILDASVRGQQVLQRQTFTIQREFVAGDSVILEILWSGTLAVPLGSIPIGGEMRAHFANFIDFKNGKIISQRNYDCFEAW